MAEALPRVVVLGAGFGGIEAVKSLRRAPVNVTLIDRQNHHCFQPLLYQVATGTLSQADIAWPIRSILRRQKNATVLMAEVIGVDSGSADNPSLAQAAGRLSEAGVEVHLDASGDVLAARARTLIKSPGVPQNAPVVVAARAHGVAVVVERFDESEETVVIEVLVHAAREGHKKILVGADGKMVKRITAAARRRIERLLEREVRLKVRVRATRGWMDDVNHLRALGYGAEGSKA